MEKVRSYLTGLKYDPRLEDHFIAKYLVNFRYVLLLIIAIIATGVFSFLNLPRRLNPEVKIPIVSVTTALPGAGPEDIESLITIPIEDEIVGLEKVKTVSSNSSDSFSQIAVEFESGTDPAKAKDDVQSAVDTISNLPKDAQTPKVQKLDFENQPVWTFLITSTGDDASLMSFAKNLEDKIENIPSVKEVQVSGIDQEEVQITVNSNTKRQYDISPQALSLAIQSAVNAQPAGILNTENSTFSLTIDPAIENIEDVRKLELNLNGQVVKLGQIAQIAIVPKPNIAKTYFVNTNTKPTRGVIFSVFKTDSANINKSVEDVKKVVDLEFKSYQDTFRQTSILNLAKEVDDSFNDLAGSFRDTIILVTIVLFIFLGIRQALIVAFAIPLSFLIAFTVMDITGLTLNFLSLFSLILALGLLVDDAIVVVTAVTSYWRTNKFTPNQTGLLVLRDFVVPIWSTTITAVWAFLPILIATGIIGEFIKSISIVVSTTLIASTAIAILVTLPLMVVFLKPQIPSRVKILINLIIFLVIIAIVFGLSQNSPLLPINIVATILLLLITFKLRRELSLSFVRNLGKIINVKRVGKTIHTYANSGIIDSQKLAHKYQRLLDRLLNSKSAQNKTLIIVVLFAVFSYLLIPLGLIKNEFFPKNNSDSFYITLELPTGTSLQSSQNQAQSLLGELSKIPDAKFITAEIGKSLSTSDFFNRQGGANNILFTVVLTKENSIKAAEEVSEQYKNYNPGKISVIEQSSGPPAGADLQIKLSGEDFSVLNQYADKIIVYLANQPQNTNVSKSITAGTSKIVFVPNKSKLAQYGLSESAIGNELRIFASGFTLDSDVKFDGETYDIVYRNSSKIRSPQDLGTITIPTKVGQIPLSSLGTLKLESNPTRITRENQKRTISVSSTLKKGFTAPKESANLEKFAKSLNLPSGYDWTTGGVNEENQKSLNSIFQAMVIAAILIMATMVLQFGSYRKAFIILLKIPIAISGVFMVFAITQTPLSFPTVIGILALFGITVYQSMLIVDKINKNQKAGMHLKHAISDACASRVEPILFGTICTVVGLIPITLSDPLWRGLGGAIIAGLLFSGIIMLLFIPVVYFKVFEKEN